MKKLIVKALILVLPLLVLTGYFFVADPMKIIHQTNNPVSPGVLMNDRLFQARYLNDTKLEYNAFIFGSSRSKAFKTTVWKTHLNENALPFHMGVNDESLYGLERKLKYLDSLGFSINHVLICMDSRLLSQKTNSEAHIFREYYTLTGEPASSYFQRFYVAFLNWEFLKDYWKYERNGRLEPNGSFLWNPGFTYYQKTGDIYYSRMDREIAKDSLQFYTKNAAIFSERTPTIDSPQIDSEAKTLLESIHKILVTHKTSYKIVVTPNYDWISLNPEDLSQLCSIFGKGSIYDYSGKNSITDEIGNYYEHKHFKPYIATGIMNTIYNEGN